MWSAGVTLQMLILSQEPVRMMLRDRRTKRDRWRNVSWLNLAERFQKRSFLTAWVTVYGIVRNIFAVYFNELPLSLIIEWE
jgi:hypothetical protein